MRIKIPEKLPAKIEPDPILEAVVEARFKTSYPRDAIYGMLYKDIVAKFPKAINLPITQLPEEIRKIDPNLQYKPYYKFSNEKYIFQFGPQLFSLTNYNQYEGWEKFLEQIEECLSIIEKLEIADTITRLGIRYINFFNRADYGDIYNRMNVELLLNKSPIEDQEIYIRALLNLEEFKFKSNFQIANNIEMKKNDALQTGSIIDIDMFLDEEEYTMKILPELIK